MARKLMFRSREGYRRWLAYGHMRTKTGLRAIKGRKSIFKATPGYQKIYIRGRKHKVSH